MLRLATAIAFMVALGLATSCSNKTDQLGQETAHTPQTGGLSQGAALLQPFKQQLKSALQKGMAQGPEHALAVCREQAPAIAHDLSQNGVRLGRSSHKLRNPDNAAEAWLQPILTYYQTDQQTNTQAIPSSEPQTFSLGQGQTAYIEPIHIQPMCLTCHGQAIEPGLKQRLHRLYPKDAATGFNVGDFRGVFWVVYPSNATGR